MQRDQVIKLWIVVYDQDQRRIYSFTDYNKMVNSVEGSIASYITDDDKEADKMIEYCVDYIKQHAEDPCIPIVFGKLSMVIYKWSLDYTNNIHRVLIDCYSQITDDILKKRIEDLFSVDNN